MRRNVFRWMGLFVGVVCLALLGAGCGGGRVYYRPTASLDPHEEGALAGIDVVRVGDRITVIYTDVPNPPPAMEQRVRDDGRITLPFNEEVEAAGKRISDLQEEIRQKLLKYFNRLTVTVRIEGRYIHVGGYVRMPGRYDYEGQMTVLDAIKVAGDFTEFAKRTAVRVTRTDGTEIIVNCKKALEDPRYDPPLYPRDDVYVPKKLW